MRPLQKDVVPALRRLKLKSLRQPRRHASDSHGSHSSHESHHAGPVNESFGATADIADHEQTGFYLTLAAFPASFALYKFTSQGTDEQPYFTRVITDTYNGYAKKWAERNDLHTQAREQAAADRLLFLNEPNQGVRQVNVRFPESLNGGSPWNVPAGHGHANLDELVAKYEKEAFAENERKHQQLRENKVPSEQPFPKP